MERNVSIINAVEESSDTKNDHVYEAIEKLKSLNDHIKLANEQYKTQETQINTIANRGNDIQRGFPNSPVNDRGIN